MTQILASAILGFIYFEIISHPKRTFRKKAPTLKLGRLELYPSIRIHGRTRAIHIHHWIYLPLILAISVPTDFRLLDWNLFRSFLVGGTLQGFLINKKARRLIYQKPLEQSDEYR